MHWVLAFQLFRKLRQLLDTFFKKCLLLWEYAKPANLTFAGLAFFFRECVCTDWRLGKHAVPAHVHQRADRHRDSVWQ